MPAIYGGVIMALISTIPFVSLINCFCCAGILLGGFLAVFFYQKERPPDAPPLVAGDCMVVGLFAGLVGAVLGSILSWVFLAVFGNIAGEIIKGIIADLNIDLPEEARESLEKSMSTSATFLGFLVQLFSNLLVYGIFGLLGGLIGYSVYKPKGMTPMAPPPPAMPMP